MQKFKLQHFVPMILISFFLVFTACEEEIEAPSVTIMELGMENSKIAYQGSDLHIEAEIIADGKIDVIKLEIHPEGEHDHDHDHTKSGAAEAGWEATFEWTEFSGRLNTSFHEHVDIPLTAEVGHYHLHFEVVDMEGNVTSVEDEIEIKAPENTNAPDIVISNAPSDHQVFHDDEDITISGTISHDLQLGGLYVGLVRKNQNLTDDEVNANSTITMLHTHDFDSMTEHDFTATIKVGAENDNDITPDPITGDIAWEEGEYYILVKSKDAFGGPFGYSQHYHIEIHFH